MKRKVVLVGLFTSLIIAGCGEQQKYNQSPNQSINSDKPSMDSQSISNQEINSGKIEKITEDVSPKQTSNYNQTSNPDTVTSASK